MAEPEQDPMFNSSTEQDDGGVRTPTVNQADIFRALEVVDRDSTAIAESFTSLFTALRVALSEVSPGSIRFEYAENCLILCVRFGSQENTGELERGEITQ